MSQRVARMRAPRSVQLRSRSDDRLRDTGGDVRVFRDVPTTEGAKGHKVHKGVWRGFAAPKSLPKEIAAQYETAIKKIWDSEEFMNKRGFDMIYLGSAGF